MRAPKLLLQLVAGNVRQHRVIYGDLKRQTLCIIPKHAEQHAVVLGSGQYGLAFQAGALVRNVRHPELHAGLDIEAELDAGQSVHTCTKVQCHLLRSLINKI